jgi:hypothetical protein
MFAGDPLVGLGCPAQRADAGGNGMLRGRLRGSRMPLRRRNPLAECPPPGGIAVVPGFQLLNPRPDRVEALADLLPAPLRRL